MGLFIRNKTKENKNTKEFNARDCDNIIGFLYFFALWIGFSKW